MKRDDHRGKNYSLLAGCHVFFLRSGFLPQDSWLALFQRYSRNGHKLQTNKIKQKNKKKKEVISVIAVMSGKGN